VGSPDEASLVGNKTDPFARQRSEAVGREDLGADDDACGWNICAGRHACMSYDNGEAQAQR
jgi:hypothetical protein